MKTIEVKIDGKVVLSTEIEETTLNTQKPVDMPNKGDVYFYILGWGSLADDIWKQSDTDIGRYNQGNCFLIKDDAEQELIRREKVTAIKRRIKELNDGWVPDFDDRNQVKHTIIHDHESNKFVTIRNIKSQYFPDWMYCKTNVIAELIIDEFGDDLNYLFI